VPLAEDLSPALRQAIVLSEDRRFWAHSGVDWAAVAAAPGATWSNTRTRGASTLTMQLAGLLDDGLARPPGGRSAWQKLGQAVLARRIEARWSKSQILEAYLNSVPLRGELVGVGAIAQTMFGKHASAGWTNTRRQSPPRWCAAPTRRPRWSANAPAACCSAMQRDCAGVRTQAALALARQGGMPLGEQLAPHYARLVCAPPGPRGTQRQHAGRRPAAGGDRRAARPAGRAAGAPGRGRCRDRAGQRQRRGAAWVGANGDTSAAAQVDGVLARRQPGSTLKPFVYGLAFERRLLTPASLLDDSPAQISHRRRPVPAAELRPPAFKGWVSARTALGASLNVPAVRVGRDAAARRAACPAQCPGPGPARERRLVRQRAGAGQGRGDAAGLANAYRTLANGGPVHGGPLPRPAARAPRRWPTRRPLAGRRHPGRQQRGCAPSASTALCARAASRP
jgi:penicillin-binding protein 1C